jgi:hypothetical protein
MAAPRYQFKMYDPFLSFSNPDSSLFVKIADGLPTIPRNADNNALLPIAREAYKRLPLMKSKSDFDKEFSNYHDELDVFRMVLKELKARDCLVTALSDGTEIDYDFETAADEVILANGWTMHSENRDLNTAHETERDFITMFSFVILIKIDLVLYASTRRAEGAIEAAIQAAEALSNVRFIELAAMKQRVKLNLPRRFLRPVLLPHRLCPCEDSSCRERI